MAKRLFVGGLPYSVDNSKLEQMFSEVGIVSSATVITDRETGQSKGFGFVEFEKDADADEAIKKLNDTEVDGRKIVVNVARPREERPRFDNRGGGGGGGRW
ncbi:MAG: glycine-rich RNA binding protein [candidate division WWE3 bacterium CSP1-7]|jgi:RNA recognition motif-containing protein|uniref:Glycine-rich RNA binding protein n=1 Tax=candidate division WWE3 bacterium CSP1-7 TaxID=1576480 RepID=A0A0T5ZYF2_UNCKA|nr:MAG: glycine-rich RNA binding protein [candidate division WWE3 bacterium CSP1-7]